MIPRMRRHSVVRRLFGSGTTEPLFLLVLAFQMTVYFSIALVAMRLARDGGSAQGWPLGQVAVGSLVLAFAVYWNQSSVELRDWRDAMRRLLAVILVLLLTPLATGSVRSPVMLAVQTAVIAGGCTTSAVTLLWLRRRVRRAAG